LIDCLQLKKGLLHKSQADLYMIELKDMMNVFYPIESYSNHWSKLVIKKFKELSL